MPAPLRYCAHVGCPVKVAYGRCPTHQRDPWYQADQPERIRGRRLQRLRAHLFDRQPICVLCEAQGRTTLATIRDHITPLAEGGRDDESNVQALCQACSDLKTAKESARGKRRA